MRMLHRSKNDKILAGICAGIGEQYSLDPTIIRLALVFLCVSTGVVPLIVTYLVGIFIIPEKSKNDISDK